MTEPVEKKELENNIIQSAYVEPEEVVLDPEKLDASLV